MSIRKGLTLLLLAAFGLSTVAPALAININTGVTYQTLAQDEGSATAGAKDDVVATNIIFDLNNSGDLSLRTDGTTALGAGDTATFSSAGVLTPTGFDVGADLDDDENVTLFVPPTGCKFVRLPGYVDLEAAGSFAYGTAATHSLNVTVTNSGNLPAGVNFLGFQVLGAAPTAITNDATAATFTTGGILALHAFAEADSATQNSALVRLTTQNIGMACSASSAALTTGDLNVTVLQPTEGSYLPALPNLTGGTSVKVAEFGDNVGKLEALIAGQTTGTVNGVAEDTQVSTLISNTALQSVTTVNFGPSEQTRVSGTSAFLDLDAIFIRAAEQPNSTSSNRLFYQTPFATAKFVTDKSFAVAGEVTELIDADLTNSTLFDNESNAVITVDIEIEAFDGSASSATLAVTNAYVGLEPYRTDNTTLTTLAGSSSGTGDVNGFLGAAAFPVTQFGSTTAVADADAGIIAVDPGSANHVVDGINLAGAELQTWTGFDESGTAAANQSGVVDADYSAIGNATTTEQPFTSQNTERAFLFPGVQVDNLITGGGDIDVIIQNVADDGTTTTFTTNAAGAQDATSAGDDYRNNRSIFANLLPFVANDDGAQYHILFGDDDGATSNAAKADVRLGATNLSEEVYHKAAEIENANNASFEDNVVLASKLTSAGDNKKFTVHILPFTNKYDAQRDLISIRPQGTITLASATLTEGLKLKATVSGNNLPSTATELTLASIVPSGSVTTNITTRMLPVSGDQDQLLSHQTDAPTLSRAEVNVADLDGTTTIRDSIEDIVGSGRVLDTTVPPLFGCGLAGNTSTGTAARGPKGCVQPKARVLEIAEAADGDFSDINDLGDNARIRVTMPAGVDINTYSGATAADYDDILNIFATGGMSAPTNANITNVQRISSTVSQAFIDIDLPATSPTTNSIQRAIYLVFRPDALVVPVGTTDLNASVSIVDQNNTDATFTDDTVLATVGNVALADSLSQMLMLSFEQQATSAFRSTTPSPVAEGLVRPTVESKYGAQNTSFPSTISKVVRFVNNDSPGDDNILWDLKIEEGVADAIPLGTKVDGTPTRLFNDQDDPAATDAGFVNSITAGNADAAIGDVAVVCTTSDVLLIPAAIVNDSGAIKTTNPAEVFFSDSSITAEGGANGAVEELAGFNNSFSVRLATGTLSGAPRPADEKTAITIKGIRYRQPGSTPPAADIDIACWVEVDDTDGDGAGQEVVIGSSIGRSFGQNATTATEYVSVYTDIAEIEDELVDLRFGAAAPVADEVDFDDSTDLVNGVFNTTFLNSVDVIDNAFSFVVDDNSSNLKLLDSNTPVSITTGTLPAVNGVDVTNGDVAATISAAAGTLEPGTLLNISTSSPNTESVRVPVLDDGSFTAVIRTAPTATVTITQTPSTANTSANIQLKTLNVEDAGTTPDPTDDPAFDGTVPTLLTSTLVEGEVVALFDAPATTNFTFADVESTASVNGVAVEKLGDKFAAVVSTTGTYTLAVTVDGETVSTTLDVTTTEKSKKGSLKNLRALKTDKNGRFVLRQRRGKLPNDLNLEIVYDDGTTAVVNNADLSRNRLGVVKFDNPESDKTISYVQLLSAKKGSRVAQ